MDDGEQDSARAVISNDPRIIIATTVAAFFFAGSAYMWRSLPKSVLASSHQRGESVSKDPDSAVKVEPPHIDSDAAKSEGTSSAAHGTGVTAASANGGGESEGLSVDSKDAKNARSKERRRRGKDPTKELLKNVKKSKSFLKPTKPTIDLSETPESPPPLAKSFREQTGIARERAQDSSGHSRSLSRASVDGRPYHSANVESDGSDRPRTQDTTEHEDSPFLNTTPTASRSLYFGTDNAEDVFTIATSSESPSLVASSTQESTATTRPSDYPTISLSASSSTSNSGSILSSTSNLTPNTSPTLSPSWKDVTPLPRPPPPANTSSSTPLPKNMSESTSLPAVSESGSWDWDGAGPSTVHEHLPSRKPPRFRSKSRGGSGSITMSPSIPESAMLTRFSESSDSGPGSSTSSQSVDQLPEFVFPSLSALSGTSVPSPMSPTTNRAGPGAASSSGSVPRRAPTPGRRPPTPRSSTNTPPPSLSAQTQLASLRGALEASRIREEKQKLDIEKVNKELEVARYEWAASRSRELDLQNQIHQLAHQMQQMYATMAGSTPKPANSTTSTGTPSGNGSDSTISQSTSDTSTPNAQPNGFQFPPPPAAGNPQTPSHLHMSPAQMQMYLPSGLLSPLAMSHTAPHSPFHPYPYSPMAGMPSPYHYASPSPMFPSLYSSMNGLDSNGGRSAGDSGPSSTAGSSSAGSHSPDLSMLGSRIMSSSSTPPPGSSSIQSRGRGRSRRSGSAEVGEQNGVGEGLSALDDQLMGDALATFGAGKLSRRSPFPLEENHDDDDSDVNNVLADAILKRPGSIRGLSRRKKSDKDMSKDNVEFVFPSLSNLGNVNASRGDITPEESTAEVIGQGEEIQEIAAPEPQGTSKVDLSAVNAPLDDTAEETTPPAVNGGEESIRSEATQEAA